MNEKTGHCLCGRVRYAYAADAVLWQMICHCESCRRACAAPFVSWIGLRNGDWRWTQGQPATTHSSANVQRQFCPDCGTQLTYRHSRWPHETHFTASTMKDPAAFAPSAHVWVSEALPWAQIEDGLPRHAQGGEDDA